MSSVEFKEFCEGDEGLDTLSDINYKGLPQSAVKEGKDNILRSILMKEKVLKVLTPIQQIMDGLTLFGVLDKVRSHTTLFEPVFCNTEEYLWDFEKVDQILVPDYAPEGRAERLNEINTYKAFLDALERLFYSEDAEERKLFPRVLQFITGSSTLPPLGLPNNISVSFKKTCEEKCKCKPTASTCALSIELPIHYKNETDMLMALKDAVELSSGFSDV